MDAVGEEVVMDRVESVLVMDTAMWWWMFMWWIQHLMMSVKRCFMRALLANRIASYL